MSDKCNRCNKKTNGTCYTVCETESQADINAAAVAADSAAESIQTANRRNNDFSDPVCISTSQIYDSCRDRDCVTDARVYLTADGEELIENAINVKLKRAEIIRVYSNVEPLSFNNGYYSVDLKFFIRTTLDVFTGVSCPTTICGLTTFDKRVILYGSEGNTKVFKSTTNNCGSCTGLMDTSMPAVVIEAVEPVALGAKLYDPCECNTCCSDCECGSFPECVCSCFDNELVVSNDTKQVLVSFGLFSIIRLERDSQLMIEAVDFCVPTRECSSATEENPCELFNDIRFPVDEFFPPQKRNDNTGCGCGCN